MMHFVAIIALFLQVLFESCWMGHLLGKPFYSLPHHLSFTHAHIITSFVTSLFSCFFFKKRFQLPSKVISFLFLSLFLLLLPWFGSFSLFTATLLLIYQKKDPDIPFSTEDEDKEMQALFEFEIPDYAEEEFREKILQELEIEPFIDILRGSDISLKNGVIQKLSGIISPVSIKLLRMSLRDESSEVRLMASKSLSKIEATMNDEIATAFEAVAKDPQNIKLHNVLGHIYYRYALIQLLDDPTQKYYIDKALQEFLISLQYDFFQEDLLLLVGKIFLQTHHLDKAIEIFNRVIKLNPNHSDVHFLLCEAFLGQRNFSAIEKEVEMVRKKFSENKINIELINYWLSHERKDSKAA